MQAADDNERKLLQLGEPSSSLAAANGDDHWQATSGSVQGVEDGAADAADPSHPPTTSSDLPEARAAPVGESGDTGAAAGAADAVLDSTRNTAVPGSGNGRRGPQDSAEGSNRSIQVCTSAFLGALSMALFPLEQFGSARQTCFPKCRHGHECCMQPDSGTLHGGYVCLKCV